MVVPSATKAGAQRRKPRRHRNADSFAAIAVTVTTLGAALIVVALLLRSSEAPAGGAHVRRGTPAPDAATASGGGAARGVAESDAGGDAGGTTPLSAATRAEATAAADRPYVMYGTAWKEEATADLVYQALRAGFRFVDTACQPKHYDEPGVGLGWKRAARELGLAREELFLQTKFTSPDGQDPRRLPYPADARLEDQVRASVRASLRHLQTDYIDSLVLHSPLRRPEDTMRVWRVLEAFVEEGKIRQLGISNCYEPRAFERLYAAAKIKPKVLQNRFHAGTGFDVELRGLCAQRGVRYQSFWTLTGNRGALASAPWKEAADEKGLTPQTLMYALAMALGHSPLSGTQDPEHMRQDVEIMARMRSEEDLFFEGDVRYLTGLLGIPLER